MRNSYQIFAGIDSKFIRDPASEGKCREPYGTTTCRMYISLKNNSAQKTVSWIRFASERYWYTRRRPTSHRHHSRELVHVQTYQYESTRIKIDSPRNHPALSWLLHDLCAICASGRFPTRIKNRWPNSNDRGLGSAQMLTRPKFITRDFTAWKQYAETQGVYCN